MKGYSMKIKGKWHGQPYWDYANRRWLITFETPEKPTSFDTTQDKELSIEVKEYKEKRSLNANSYFHVLVDKIAEVQGVSHSEIHNHLIADYGYMDEEIKNVIMDADVPWERLDSIHLRPTSYTKTMDNGKLYRIYIVMRGSHTYDTKEMSRLIDGTVYEAKQLGIEVLSPNELERIKQTWKAS